MFWVQPDNVDLGVPPITVVLDGAIDEDGPLPAAQLPPMENDIKGEEPAGIILNEYDEEDDEPMLAAVPPPEAINPLDQRLTPLTAEQVQQVQAAILDGAIDTLSVCILLQ